MIDKKIGQAIEYLKNLTNYEGFCTSYMLVNHVEFSFDISCLEGNLNEDLNKFTNGYNTLSAEVVDIKLGDYIEQNDINSLSVEVQIRCENEEEFVEDLRRESIPFVFQETFYAQDETSRDYSVYAIELDTLI